MFCLIKQCGICKLLKLVNHFRGLFVYMAASEMLLFRALARFP